MTTAGLALRVGAGRWLGGLLAGAVGVAAVTTVVALLEPSLPALGLLPLYLLAVLPVAVRWGAGPAAVVSVASTVLLGYLFLPSSRRLWFAEVDNAAATGVFLVTAVVVGNLAARLRRAAEHSARLSAEQAALRRVATQVAREAPPEEVFATVVGEIGRLLGADSAAIVRLDPDGLSTVIAQDGDGPERLPVGSRWSIEPPLALGVALRTGEPARRDGYEEVPGEFAELLRQVGVRSSVAIPVVAGGRTWGALGAQRRGTAFPADAEQRIAEFTEIVAIAIANAESRTQLAASRARIIAATDATRRRLERDLHDGAQQRLVSLALELRQVESAVPAQVRADLDRMAGDLTEALDELRELSRGIHPVVLSEGGLGPALRAIARRAQVPVELDVRTAERFPEPVEVAAYYVVSEAVTNTTKHGGASYVEVTLDAGANALALRVRDDGAGGADPARGSGLTGLRDRVEALGGSIHVTSPAGAGTTIEVSLPLAR
ncbi:GAF domain-containing protein [Phytohabitans flavus]|uniref:histidine kinase n=1 Tax=Phytohabitans flavus TaxID=1076124 RepID=A0A6F8XR29_9ACTN|nr:GAF domain-containing protein [Phytohabitans flavus]BCB76294.1 histidine kinase [Phytohabitans flavus]